MKTLIRYHSRFCATERCAKRLADYIGSEASIQRLSEANGENRPLGLFLCHGKPDGVSLLKRCYPPLILARARAAEAVGGYLDLSKVPRMLRFVLALIGVKKSYDRLDNIALKRLSEAFK